jgi:ATP-dependent DNA helicase RecQ
MTETEILKKYWGFDGFRPLQDEIIQSVLNGEDTLALLPTGGGKSICFQVPAMVMDGICIVVSPLIALMKDQVENLKAKGISAIAIYAGMGKREIDILLDNCIYGNVKFLYLSPERLLADLVKARIGYMNVNLIAIDEAHCISQWGYDFRPPYLKIKDLREIHPKVPILALTATATPYVREDIAQKLELRQPAIFVKSFERRNLSYVVFDLEDKHQKMLEVAKNVKGTGLIYVRNRRETTEVAYFLQRNGIAADFYHAGVEKDLRFKKQEDWKKDIIRIMVATNAFGMGIDKPDVRFVIHLDLPESLEAYYQEAGRAGRDEKRAFGILLANKSDQLILNAKYADSYPTVAEIKKTYHYLGNYFQLAFGSGEGLTFGFDVADFCKKFKLPVVKTLAALKFLERDGYIALSENVFLPSRLMFTVSHEDVYRFQIENAGYDPLIKTIQRSYGGAFDGYVKIKESDLSNRLKISFNDVVGHLNRLQQLELISYIPQTDQPQLQFVLPRADQTRLDIDSKFIKLRQEIQQQQIKAVLSYAANSVCRSQQLLHYFGELAAAKCGFCDICLAERKLEDKEILKDKIDFEIVTLLKSAHFELDEVMLNLKSGTQTEKIDRIRELLDAGKIKTDGKKYYL